MNMTDYEQNREPEKEETPIPEETESQTAQSVEPDAAQAPEAAGETGPASQEAAPEEAQPGQEGVWDAYQVDDIEGTPEEIAAQAQPKKSVGKTIGILIAALVAVGAIVAACIFLIPRWQEAAAMGEGDVYQRTSYTAQSDEEALERADRTVAKMGDTKLTNAQLSMFYWMQYYNFVQQYGTYATYYYGLDTTAPLDGQTMNLGDKEQTWQQYFLSGALEAWAYFNAMAKEAEAAGLTLSEDMQAQLDQVATQLTTQAATNGYDSADAMIQDNFGPGVTVADYVEYLRLYQIGRLYYQQQYEALTVTDQELSDYYDAHYDDLMAQGVEQTDMPATISVRHILIKPATSGTDENGKAVSTDEDWAAAKEKAEALYQQWKSGAATEESFSEMATEYSEDPGSNTNGGLYENVQPGKMVEAFNDWCFDTARKAGDTGIVESSFGYHIMYFVQGSEEVYWKAYVKELILEEKTQAMTDTVMDAHPYKVNYQAIYLAEMNKQTEE